MKEALDQWVYVLWAYGLGIGGTLLVTAWSLVAMLRAEARRDKVRRK
jgi:hypothetical protein